MNMSKTINTKKHGKVFVARDTKNMLLHDEAIDTVSYQGKNYQIKMTYGGCVVAIPVQ
jgi:hypothetical protein